MRIKYTDFVEDSVKEWTASDGGLTNAACDVLYQAKGFDNIEPTIEDFFSDDFATQYAARCWEEWNETLEEK